MGKKEVGRRIDREREQMTGGGHSMVRKKVGDNSTVEFVHEREQTRRTVHKHNLTIRILTLYVV